MINNVENNRIKLDTKLLFEIDAQELDTLLIIAKHLIRDEKIAKEVTFVYQGVYFIMHQYGVFETKRLPYKGTTNQKAADIQAEAEEKYVYDLFTPERDEKQNIARLYSRLPMVKFFDQHKGEYDLEKFQGFLSTMLSDDALVDLVFFFVKSTQFHHDLTHPHVNKLRLIQLRLELQTFPREILKTKLAEFHPYFSSWLSLIMRQIATQASQDDWQMIEFYIKSQLSSN